MKSRRSWRRRRRGDKMRVLGLLPASEDCGHHAGALVPAVATAIGRHLAWRYERDPASIDWRHLGRLLGIGFRCAFLLKTKDELGSYGIFPYGRPSAIACRGQGRGRGSFRIFRHIRTRNRW
jgi:hypothetical protein